MIELKKNVMFGQKEVSEKLYSRRLANLRDRGHSRGQHVSIIFESFMAPRLAVVVSQAPHRDARTADIEESIVAELIMVGGLDATLVGPLQRILPDSTDLLCLSGFTQDLALLSWMPTDEAARLWEQLQLTGTVVPMSLDGSAASPALMTKGRRVLYIQLTPQSVPSQVCKQLKSRLELLRIQPVSLQLNLQSPKKTLPVASPPPTMGPKAEPSDKAESSPLNPSAEHLSSKVVESQDSEWKNLDQLVDQLDLLDL